MKRIIFLTVAMAFILTVGAAVVVADDNGAREVRIAAQHLGDGRIEFALQERGDGGWGERILPENRFLPADSGGIWLSSSPITLGKPVGTTMDQATTGPDLRITARRLVDGRVEFALQEREDAGWGERILPTSRFLPADSRGRWLSSSPIVLGEAEDAAMEPATPPTSTPVATSTPWADHGDIPWKRSVIKVPALEVGEMRITLSEGETLEYRFDAGRSFWFLRELDIDFRLLNTSGDVLREVRRAKSLNGEVTAESSGVYTLVFDNWFSFVTSKTVTLRYRVLAPGDRHVASRPTATPTQGAADLVVDTATVSDNNPTAGESFTLSATVSNQGSGPSDLTTLRYYRSTDTTIMKSDTEAGTGRVPAVPASGSKAESISLTAPSTAGTYYYGACVDAVSGESDTTNNCSSAVIVTITTTPNPTTTPTPKPGASTPSASADFLTFEHDSFGIHMELRVLEVVRGHTGNARADFWLDDGNEWVKVVVEVRNRGDDDFSFNSNAFALTGASNEELGDTFGAPDTDNLLTDKEILPGTVVRGDIVMQGPGNASYLALSVAPVFFSVQYLPLTAGAANAPPATPRPTATPRHTATPQPTATPYPTATPTQGAADLVVESVSTSDTSPDTGDSFTLRATVRNQGSDPSSSTTLRYYRSADTTITTSDTEAGTGRVPTVPASDGKIESISLTAPSMTGTYYYGACVDAVVGESDTGNNCSRAVAVSVTAEPTATPRPSDGDGLCRVGLVVRLGESCVYPSTSEEFSVDSSGRGRFLFFVAGTSINARNVTINGVRYNFAASKQTGGAWVIEAAG